MLTCGQEVIVQCMQPLWQEATTNPIILMRPTTPNNFSAVDTQGEMVPITMETAQNLRLEGDPIPFPVFIRYYPVLKMLVQAFSLEGGQENYPTKWRLELEEV